MAQFVPVFSTTSPLKMYDIFKNTVNPADVTIIKMRVYICFSLPLYRNNWLIPMTPKRKGDVKSPITLKIIPKLASILFVRSFLNNAKILNRSAKGTKRKANTKIERNPNIIPRMPRVLGGWI